jgi:uncharacterized protein YndB with AHSA1/START domain
MASDRTIEASPSAVQIRRDFNAGTASVWRAWTDPAVVSQWFGSDPAGTVVNATLDVRPGGTYSITFRDSSGLEHTRASTASSGTRTNSPSPGPGRASLTMKRW